MHIDTLQVLSDPSRFAIVEALRDSERAVNDIVARVDIHQSGTVAAVREAAILGIPGIALSHYLVRGLELDWERARDWAGRV